MVIINEEWRSVDSYINYQVSNVGRVRYSKTGRILKPNLGSNGYFTVGLSKNGGVKTHNIHQLVAREFLRNPLDLKCIDHIDGNGTNNKIENLREATQSQNLCNIKRKSSNKSGVKNVVWCESSNKWGVFLKVNGRQKYFGVYPDIELAELVAVEARNKYQGQFANHTK